jgi:FlaA1/EpsC-like NDP-sugar epimerase
VRDENNPTGDVEITYIGLRPGEKLREELLIANAIEGTQHPRILKCQEPSLPTAKYDAVLARLRSAMAERSESEIRSILAETIEQFAGNEVLPRDTAVRAGAVTSRLVH